MIAVVAKCAHGVGLDTGVVVGVGGLVQAASTDPAESDGPGLRGSLSLVTHINSVNSFLGGKQVCDLGQTVGYVAQRSTLLTGERRQLRNGLNNLE